MERAPSVTDLLGGLVPGAGRGASRLLAALINSHPDRELSLADLARATGTSGATTMREVDRLLAAGLLLEQRTGRERQLTINASSPFFGPLADLLFIAHGAEPREWGLPAEHMILARRPLFDIPAEVSRHVPPDLLPRHWDQRTLPREILDGPTLPAARSVVLQLRSLSARSSSAENRLQATYARWHDERDRDLIHLTLHAGIAARYAEALLAEQTRYRAENNVPDQEPRVGRLTWARAVYSVQAEARTCHGITRHLEGVVERASAYHRAKRGLEQVQEMATEGDASVWQEEADDFQQKMLAASKALEGTYRYGGIPSIDSVGCAGERLLAVEFQQLTTEAGRLAAEMAKDPGFLAWAEEHPEVVTVAKYAPPGSTAEETVGDRPM